MVIPDGISGRGKDCVSRVLRGGREGKGGGLWLVGGGGQVALGELPSGFGGV